MKKHKTWQLSMLFLIATLLLACQSTPKADLQASADITFAKQLAAAPKAFDQKIAFLLESNLGKSFAWAPLGESNHDFYDSKPSYRSDAFDCMTFVTTILAMSTAHDIHDFHRNMAWLNYHDGKQRFLKRRHFPSMDWNPALMQKGLLKDINTMLAKKVDPMMLKTQSAWINKPHWYHTLHAKKVALASGKKINQHWQQDIASLSGHHVKLAYVDKAYLKDPKNLEKLEQSLPDGASVIEWVIKRPKVFEAKIGSAMLIAHMGIVFKSKDKANFYHAYWRAGKVIRLPFAYMVQKLPNSIAGISVYAIQAKPISQHALISSKP